VCEASAAARQFSPTPCGWVCDHSRAPTIFRDANTGAGQLPARGCARSIGRDTPIISNALRLGLRPQPRSNDFP